MLPCLDESGADPSLCSFVPLVRVSWSSSTERAKSHKQYKNDLKNST